MSDRMPFPPSALPSSLVGGDVGAMALAQGAVPAPAASVAPPASAAEQEEILLELENALDDEQLQQVFCELLREAKDYGQRLDDVAAQATSEYLAGPLGD